MPISQEDIIINRGIPLYNIYILTCLRILPNSQLYFVMQKILRRWFDDSSVLPILYLLQNYTIF